MERSIIEFFWNCIHNAEFDSLSEIMSDDACVWLPNTQEVFCGKYKYIEFNKKYPGRWYVNLENKYVCDDTIISVAKVFNAENTLSFYVTSFFKLQNNLIVEIVEYWGENGKPPAWRLEENFSVKYNEQRLT